MPVEQHAGSSGSDRRETILDKVAAVLIRQKLAATEMQDVVEHTGLSVADVDAEFPDLDDLLVALAARTTTAVCQPLALGARVITREQDARAALLDFGLALRQAYGSVMIGFYRVAMTEGSRRRALRHRIFEADSGATAAALRAFLERMVAERRFAVGDCGFAAEHLMGMLREPLYRELTLHSYELISDADPSTAVREAVDIFLNGCGTLERAR